MISYHEECIRFLEREREKRNFGDVYFFEEKACDVYCWDRCMDGWMDGWMDRWMDRWIDGSWVDGWMDRWIDSDRWMGR